MLALRAATALAGLVVLAACDGASAPLSSDEAVSQDFAQFLPEVFDEILAPDEVDLYCSTYMDDPQRSHRLFVESAQGAPMSRVNLDDYSKFMADFC